MTKHPNSTFSDDDGNNINQSPGKKGLKIVPIVTEWVEITEGTLLGDIAPNGLKMSSNYDRIIDKFRKDIPEDKMKEYDLISEKIKDFVQDRFDYRTKVCTTHWSCHSYFLSLIIRRLRQQTED